MKKFFKTFLANHPRSINFMKNRFNADFRNGLYLTIGFIIISFFTYVFYNLIEDLVGEVALLDFDHNLLNNVQNIRTAFLNRFMLFITHFGDWQIILFAAISLSLVLIILKKWKYTIALASSTVVGEIFVYTVKDIIKRQGPPLRYSLFLEHDYSFPSGHSFFAIAFYGLIFYFIYKFLKNKYLKALSIFIGFILIILIGFSRIYLGVHWPSDVFASFSSGIVLLSLIITYLEIDYKFGFKDTDIISASLKLYALLAGIILFVVWFIYIIILYFKHPLLL
jgi:membrane-associated phospholipid phosphatase